MTITTTQNPGVQFDNQGIFAGTIVEGVRCGRFLVMGFRTVGGEAVADVKPVGPDGKPDRSKMVMPLGTLKAA